MSVPAADNLRRAHTCHDPEGECVRWAVADLLEAIDARHYPVNWPGQGMFCHRCPEPWPCTEHRLLHPEVQP